jgi:hypothetical protein
LPRRPERSCDDVVWHYSSRVILRWVSRTIDKRKWRLNASSRSRPGIATLHCPERVKRASLWTMNDDNRAWPSRESRNCHQSGGNGLECAMIRLRPQRCLHLGRKGKPLAPLQASWTLLSGVVSVPAPCWVSGTGSDLRSILFMSEH